jgi:hypothetical protein
VAQILGCLRSSRVEHGLLINFGAPKFEMKKYALSRRKVFSFSIARELLERFEGTPLEMDMRSVLAKIADSLRGTVSLDVESLTDQFTLLARGSRGQAEFGDNADRQCCLETLGQA